MCGSVFYGLHEPEEAVGLVLRSQLMHGLTDYIKRHGLTRSQAAMRMGESEARIEHLERGQISKLPADSLLRMTARAGLTLRVELSDSDAVTPS